MTTSPTVERLLYIALFMIFIGVSTVFVILVSMLRAQANVSQEIKRAVIELKADKAARDRIILDHTDCIAFFLSQPNRAAVRIQDIQGCKLVSN